MHKEKIIYSQCDITGSFGYKFKKNLNKNTGEIRAGNGLLVAHDIIEHQRGIQNIGTVFDEIMALGGWWFTRVETGSTNFNNEEESLRSEFPNLIKYTCVSAMQKRLSKSRKIIKNYLEDHVIEYINKIDFDYCLKEDEDLTVEKFEVYKQYFIYHFKLGYRMANKRFKGNNYLALDLFKRIEEKIDNAAFHEIIEATVSYDLNGKVNVTPKDW